VVGWRLDRQNSRMDGTWTDMEFMQSLAKSDVLELSGSLETGKVDWGTEGS